MTEGIERAWVWGARGVSGTMFIMLALELLKKCRDGP